MSAEADEGLLVDTFTRSCGEDPAPIYERLIATCKEFETLLEYKPDVGFLFRTEALIRNECQILGTVYCGITVNGTHRDLFEWFVAKEFSGRIPDFLIILDAGYWREKTDLHREILMHHEVCHMIQKTDQFGAPRFFKQTGLPVWGLRGHDVEEFILVVQRYGAHTGALRDLIRAGRGPRETDADNDDAERLPGLRLVSKT